MTFSRRPVGTPWWVTLLAFGGALLLAQWASGQG
jgi:hypothetical protein